MEVTNLSVNHPFGLYHAFVCVGPGGIMKYEAIPTMRVKPPSIKNRYRQPAFPPTPRNRKSPVAMNAPEISAM